MPTITDLVGPAGPLEALLDEPAGALHAAVVFAHPHPQFGGTMHTKAVYQGTKGPSTKPKFFVQREADDVCPLEGMWAFYGRLQEPKEIVVIDGSNHLFESQAAEVGESLEELLGGF